MQGFLTAEYNITENAQSKSVDKESSHYIPIMPGQSHMRTEKHYALWFKKLAEAIGNGRIII